MSLIHERIEGKVCERPEAGGAHWPSKGRTQEGLRAHSSHGPRGIGLSLWDLEAWELVLRAEFSRKAKGLSGVE